MGALLTLPLMAVPSIGTVSPHLAQPRTDPPANVTRSWAVWLHVAELQPVLHFVEHVGSFKAGVYIFLLTQSPDRSPSANAAVAWLRESPTRLSS